MSPSEPRSVAIVGYGLSGRVFHAPLIAATPGLKLVAIVTADPGRATQARSDHPCAEVISAVDGLFDRPDPLDLVVVAAPNEAHVPLAMRCVEAGVAVVVDKPLAATAPDGLRLIERARRRGVMLTVFQNRRWDGDFLTVKRLIDDGRLGRVHRFESRFERWRPVVASRSWREDPDPNRAGGVLYDLGTHVIDQAQVLFGPALTVYAELDRGRVGAKVDDDVFLSMTHAGGVRSHLWMSAFAAQLGPRFRVLGDRAGYVKYGLDVQEAQLAAGIRPDAPDWGLEGAEHDGRMGVPGDVETVTTLPGSYERFYAGVAAALAGGAPPVEALDAVGTLEVIEAARRSAEAGLVVEMARVEGTD